VITVWSLYIPCVVKGTTVTLRSSLIFKFDSQSIIEYTLTLVVLFLSSVCISLYFVTIRQFTFHTSWEDSFIHSVLNQFMNDNHWIMSTVRSLLNLLMIFCKLSFILTFCLRFRALKINLLMTASIYLSSLTLTEILFHQWNCLQSSFKEVVVLERRVCRANVTNDNLITEDLDNDWAMFIERSLDDQVSLSWVSITSSSRNLHC